MQQNLTSGSVFQNVVRFSLPYLLSYFLQTLYGMADLFIVGQFEPVAATTAVSIGSQVMHMLTVMLVGLAMGTTVTIAQAVGAGDKKRAARAVGNTVTLFGGISALLTVVLLLLVRRITAVMSTPAEAVSGTVRYLTICFLGIPFITAYNVLSSIFRGMGDSKSPMYFIACACVCNIALDYLFMGALRLGPAGAALGTTLSQAISVLLALLTIRKRGLGLPMHRSDLRPDKAVSGDILKIGLPITCQDGLIHREPARAHRRGGGRHCGKGDQLPVPRAVFDALDRLGARRAEHRSRKARTRQKDASLCHLARGRLRRYRRGDRPVCRRTDRRPLYAG